MFSTGVEPSYRGVEMCLQGHGIVLKMGLVVVVQSCLTGGIVFGGMQYFLEGLSCFTRVLIVNTSCVELPLRRIGLIRVALNGAMRVELN